MRWFPLEAALIIITLLVPPLTAQRDAEATRCSVEDALSRVGQLESFRCRVDYEWLVDPRVTPQAKPDAPPPTDWAEHVYAGGVHVWCKVVAGHEDAAMLRSKIEEVEDEFARIRTRRNDAQHVVELEAKLTPLRLGLRDLCGDRVELQDIRSWASRRGGDWVSMRAPEAGHFPDPRFLADVLLKLLPNCEWSASVGTSEQRPVTVFELRAAGAAARTLVDSGAVTDLGLRGRRSADSTEFRIGTWCRQTTGARIAFDGWLKIRLEVDPPTKLPARIVVDVRSDFVASAVADLAAESPSSRIIMNLRLPGHARATEDDRRD